MDEIDAIRGLLPEHLLAYFDNLVTVAANYQATLQEIAEEAERGEPYSPSNHRAVAACTSIRSLALTALDY